MTMANSRTRNSALIMFFLGIRQMLTFIFAFASRTVFIYVLGAEYLGLNGLFSNILQFLSLTELGIGSAIAYYLYKPLAENDLERINAIMKFYKQCYRAVGLAMIGLGCLLMPFLPHLVNLNQPIPDNLYLIYFLFICNSAFTYLFFAYKQALVTANQEHYKIEKINIAFTFINCIVDVLVLLVFRNFTVYLLAKVALVVVKNIVIARKIDREYPYLKERTGAKLQKFEIKNLFKDVYSVFVFNVGCVMMNSVANIIISVMLGTIIVGYYSNYILVVSSLTMIFNIIIKSFTAGIGNVMATESREKQYRVFKVLDLCAFAVFGLMTVGLFQVSNSFIRVWLGGYDEAFILSQYAVFAISANFFMDSASQIIYSFRNGSGHFKAGRYLPLYGGLLNIVLSVILGKLIGLEGILLGPPVCKLLITTIPFFVFIGKDVFMKDSWTMLSSLLYKAMFIAFVNGLTWLVCSNIHGKDIVCLMAEAVVTVLIFSICLFIFYKRTDEFKELKTKLIRVRGRGA